MVTEVRIVVPRVPKPETVVMLEVFAAPGGPPRPAAKPLL